MTTTYTRPIVGVVPIPPATGNPYASASAKMATANGQLNVLQNGAKSGGATGVSLPGQFESTANQALTMMNQSNKNISVYKTGGRKTRRRRKRRKSIRKKHKR